MSAKAATLPIGLDGRDVAGQAQTGTGKTAAFLLAILHLLDQALAFGGGAVCEQEVRDMLGTVARDRVFRIVQALMQRDAKAVLAEVPAPAGPAPTPSRSPSSPSTVTRCSNSARKITLSESRKITKPVRV